MTLQCLLETTTWWLVKKFPELNIFFIYLTQCSSCARAIILSVLFFGLCGHSACSTHSSAFSLWTVMLLYGQFLTMNIQPALNVKGLWIFSKGICLYLKTRFCQQKHRMMQGNDELFWLLAFYLYVCLLFSCIMKLYINIYKLNLSMLCSGNMFKSLIIVWVWVRGWMLALLMHNHFATYVSNFHTHTHMRHMAWSQLFTFLCARCARVRVDRYLTS